MKLAFAILASILGGVVALSAPAQAQSSGAAADAACAFNSFPLALNLGTYPTGAGGDSARCGIIRMQGAVNVLATQLPSKASLLSPSFLNSLAILPLTTITPDLTYAGTPNPSVVMSMPGIGVSFCPALSCINGPPNGSTNSAFFDHQRTSLLISGASQVDAQAEEQLLAVAMTIGTGYAPAWVANTAYTKGANISIGNAIYRATTSGTSASVAPPGSRPTSAPYTYTDGGVVWLWINDAAINAKLPGYFEAKAVPGAGQVWGIVSNLHLTQGVIPTFAASNEVDLANDSGTNCVAGQANCIGQFIRVVGANYSTAGQAIQLAGSGAIFGTRISGPLLNAAVSVSTTGGTAGIGLGDFAPASFTSAAINDASTAPASLNASGTNSLSVIRVAATAPIGLDLTSATLSAWQVLGKGWSVDTVGNLRVPSISETTSAPPTSSSATCTTGQRTWDANYEYRCVSPNKWRRTALSDF